MKIILWVLIIFQFFALIKVGEDNRAMRIKIINYQDMINSIPIDARDPQGNKWERIKN